MVRIDLVGRCAISVHLVLLLLWGWSVPAGMERRRRDSPVVDSTAEFWCACAGRARSSRAVAVQVQLQVVRAGETEKECVLRCSAVQDADCVSRSTVQSSLTLVI